MAEDGWGAPRSHGELLKLRFVVAEATVSRYVPRRSAEPDQLKRCTAVLRTHKDAIAAMDFFTVPTASLRLLCALFVIGHGRRHVLHFNAKHNSTAAWVIQQRREAFPYHTQARYLISDRDAISALEVKRCIQAMGMTPRRIAYRRPWPDPVYQCPPPAWQRSLE